MFDPESARFSRSTPSTAPRPSIASPPITNACSGIKPPWPPISGVRSISKKAYIERDEFDQGPRNDFNYGHSFGHAIEAATDYAIPHGIAVTIGMDMANFASVELGIGRSANYQRMHPVLAANYRGFEAHPVAARALRGGDFKGQEKTSAPAV